MANFKYRRMFLNPNPKNVISAETNATHVDLQLSNESTLNKSAAWNKLGKTNKMKIINEYVDRCCAKEHGLNAEETAQLKLYFSQSLDEKMLQHVKDVIYDKETGQLVGVPQLAFNPTTRKFTLRRQDSHASNGTVKKRNVGAAAAAKSRPPLTIVSSDVEMLATEPTSSPWN